MKVEGATEPYPLVDGARPTSSHHSRSDSLFHFYSADQSDGSEDNVPDAVSPRRGTRPPAKSFVLLVFNRHFSFLSSL